MPDITQEVSDSLTLEARLLPLVTQRQDLIRQIAALQATADALAEEITGEMVREDVLKLEVDGYPVSFNPAVKGRESLDKAKLKLALVEAGVGTDVVNGAFTAATTTGAPGQRFEIGKRKGA